METIFTLLWLGALAAASAARVWLAARQIRYVTSHRGRVPEGFEEKITLASHRKAADYTCAKTRLAIVDVVISALVLLVLTLGGALEWLSRAWSEVFAAGSIGHGTALLVSVFALLSVLELPLTVYRVFVIEARFGFNRMTPWLFIADLVKQSAVAAVLVVPLTVLVLWMIGELGSLWWLAVWLVWMAFNLLVLIAYPIWIAPLFNTFTPLKDPALTAHIDALLARCGFSSRGLYVMDGSRRSSHGNAYFTGFGAAKRIVLFDTLISRLAAPEVIAVLAHELGHYRRRHVIKRIAVLFAGSLVVLWGLGALIDEPWFYASLGVATPTTAAGLTLYLLVLPLFTFFLQPLVSRVSRRHEYEADAFAAEHANAADLVSGLVKLYQDNAATLTPDPLHSAFYDSHPPAAMRVARLQSATR